MEHLPNFYIEQPCKSYEECLFVRKNCKLPIILDECVTDKKAIIKAWQDGAADVIDIKISKFGGISKAKEAVELCITLGLPMTISDTWGSKNKLQLVFGDILSTFFAIR